MIYKPNIVYPNMESVPVESELSPFDIYIKGLASSPIYNTFRFSINDTYFKHYEADEIKEEFDNYYLSGKIGEEIENDVGVTVRGFENENYIYLGGISYKNNKCFVPNNYSSQWRLRVYEKESLSDTENLLFDKEAPASTSYVHHCFNYRKAFNDSFGDDASFICKDYIPSSCIGYGTIQDEDIAYLYSDIENASHPTYTITAKASWTTSGTGNVIYNTNNGYKLLKIYPHILAKQSTVTVNSQSQSYYTRDSYYERYYIKIDGVYYKIVDWRYCSWLDQERYYQTLSKYGYYFKSGGTGATTTNLDCYFNVNNKDFTDGYGNPLALYVLIKDAPDNLTGHDYTLYCNYIETDSYSFELINQTSFSFYDKKQASIELSSYNTEEEALSEGKSNRIEYSNLDLTCNVNYAVGTHMSHYNVNLYQIQNGDQVLIDQTNDVYAQSISYSFDRFINDQKYLLHIKIVDSKNIVYNKYIGINSSYGVPSKLLKADIEFDYQNHYNIIDFSSAFSISGQESVLGGHSFITTEVSEYLHLNEDNTLTYCEIDGVRDISITQPLVDIVIKLDYYTQGEIWTLTDDYGNTYTLEWNGIEFVYTTTIDDVITTYICYPYEKEISSSEWLTEMMTNMESSSLNTSVPYVWDETFSQQTFNSDLYIHTETPANQCWWSVIAYPNGIKFLNLTLNTVWDGVKTENTEVE